MKHVTKQHGKNVKAWRVYRFKEMIRKLIRQWK